MMENLSFHLESIVKEKDSMQDFEGPLSLILMLLQKNKIEINTCTIRPSFWKIEVNTTPFFRIFNCTSKRPAKYKTPVQVPRVKVNPIPFVFGNKFPKPV